VAEQGTLRPALEGGRVQHRHRTVGARRRLEAGLPRPPIYLLRLPNHNGRPRIRDGELDSSALQRQLSGQQTAPSRAAAKCVYSSRCSSCQSTARSSPARRRRLQAACQPVHPAIQLGVREPGLAADGGGLVRTHPSVLPQQLPEGGQLSGGRRPGGTCGWASPPGWLRRWTARRPGRRPATSSGPSGRRPWRDLLAGRRSPLRGRATWNVSSLPARSISAPSTSVGVIARPSTSVRSQTRPNTSMRGEVRPQAQGVTSIRPCPP
jgi:hypothetical protein